MTSAFQDRRYDRRLPRRFAIPKSSTKSLHALPQGQIERPLYTDLLDSDLQRFKARYERERSLSPEPEDHMDLDSKEPEAESGMETESIVGPFRFLPSTPAKMVIRAHSYPTPESIPRVGRLASRLLPLTPTSFPPRCFMDTDILESPTHMPRQYRIVAITTSPIAVEEDVDMVLLHRIVVAISTWKMVLAHRRAGLGVDKCRSSLMRFANPLNSS